MKTRVSDAQRHAVKELPRWPVLAVPTLFPLLWVTGLTVPVAAVLTVVMVAFLVRHRDPQLPGPLLALAAFLLWTVFSATMNDDVGRLLGWGFRFVAAAFVTVSSLYLVNAPRIRRSDVLAALTTVWFFVIVGGWLGLLLPDLRLTTPVGLLLPSGVASNEYARDLFFPALAEVQTPYGAPQPFIRPSAPFPYANSWGMAMMLLSPVAVAAAMAVRRPALKVAVGIGLVALIPPAVATSNRMMFVGFAVAVVYASVRLALRGRTVPVLVTGAAGLILVPLLLVLGALTQVSQRAEYGSAGGRLMLYTETWARTLQSPILGFGGPRPSETVPGIAVGTQGQLWTVMFSYGLVGLALFLAFLLGSVAATSRLTDDVDIVLHSVLVVACFAICVYGLDIMQFLTVGLVAATLLAHRPPPVEPDW